MKVLSILCAAVLLCWLLVVAFACNYDEPGPRAPTGDTAFDAVREDVRIDCGRCHNGSIHPLVFDTGEKFRGSRARDRIVDGTMPPGGGLADDVKRRLLAYLENKDAQVPVEEGSGTTVP